MKSKQIKTERYELRPIVQEDIKFVHQGLSDPAVIKHYGVSFMTLEAAQEQMDWYAELVKEDTGQWWAIWNKEDHFIGSAGLNALHPTNRSAEIGMWLLPQYWGNGSLPEVLPAVISYAFDEMNVNRIEGFVENDNHKCKTALAKFDFQYEGTMRECEWKNGRFIDVDIYAVLKSKVEKG